MAEWPVTLLAELSDMQRGHVPPGESVAAMWANVSGATRAAIWIVCPRCGTLGHCPTQGSAEGKVKRMDAPCGGHFWLTDGVPREV